MNSVRSGTVIRTVVLLVALINQFLTIAGKSPLPFEDADVEQMTAMIITAVAAIITWWKNNSFTKAAVTADRYMNSLK